MSMSTFERIATYVAPLLAAALLVFENDLLASRYAEVIIAAAVVLDVALAVYVIYETINLVVSIARANSSDEYACREPQFYFDGKQLVEVPAGPDPDADASGDCC